MRLVYKFGGTSMAGTERITHAAGLALAGAKTHELVVVVSAMDGVTEQLLDLAAAAGSGNRARVYSLLGTIRSGHEQAARGLGGEAPAKVEGLLAKLPVDEVAKQSEEKLQRQFIHHVLMMIDQAIAADEVPIAQVPTQVPTQVQ